VSSLRVGIEGRVLERASNGEYEIDYSRSTLRQDDGWNAGLVAEVA
jgi:hypothetical protein